MKKIGKKRILSWILVFALVFSVCPDISVAEDGNGSQRASVSAYGPETVQAAEIMLSQLEADWDVEKDEEARTAPFILRLC
ncbi:MAG: hypothetical protein IJT05_05170 [Lachnospiraceae bacterium]|nr:hypothetical protein [Lachnospiraceae bacterium]